MDGDIVSCSLDNHPVIVEIFSSSLVPFIVPCCCLPWRLVHSFSIALAGSQFALSHISSKSNRHPSLPPPWPICMFYLSPLRPAQSTLECYGMLFPPNALTDLRRLAATSTFSLSVQAQLAWVLPNASTKLYETAAHWVSFRGCGQVLITYLSTRTAHHGSLWTPARRPVVWPRLM